MIKDLITKKGIAIDITNACVNKCGNCMRFCDHYEEPYFMDVDYFKKCIDSLKNFPGQIGIFGGEPTLHPNFTEMIQYIYDTYPYERKKQGFRNPVKDINSYIFNHNVDDKGKFKLFTCANTQQFYDNFELIDDVFESFRFNDHSEKTKHFTVLANYKDLGISDEDFVKMEDDCWVQNYCFAEITPKGGFFCEMAGMLDMLYDGDGGFKIEKDWWKKYKKDFGDQLDWCKKCGARLGLPMIQDSEEKDYVTETCVNELNGKSKRISKGDYRIIKKEDYLKNKDVWRSDKIKKLGIVDEICVSNNNRFLKPQNVTFVDDVNEIKSCYDWVVVNAKKEQRDFIEKYVYEHTFNPGCFYYKESVFLINVRARALQRKDSLVDKIWGYYSLDKIVQINDIEDNIIQNVKEITKNDLNNIHNAKKKSKITKILKRL